MIRAAVAEDIPECVNVIKRSFKTVADELGFTAENAPRFTAFAITAEKLLAQMQEEHKPMYVCCDDTQIIGYYSLAYNEKGCELNNLSVLPECRHNGIGEKLLQHSCETAKQLGYEVLHIGIVEENKMLKEWYQQHGFEHLGTKKFDFFPFTCGYMRKKL